MLTEGNRGVTTARDLDNINTSKDPVSLAVSHHNQSCLTFTIKDIPAQPRSIYHKLLLFHPILPSTMQLIKLISLLPLALSTAAMAGAGAYSQDRALTAREAEAGVLVGAFEDGNYDVFAREAEADPFEDEIELEVRELKEYMRKRVRFADS